MHSLRFSEIQDVYIQALARRNRRLQIDVIENQAHGSNLFCSAGPETSAVPLRSSQKSESHVF